jgi:hypothetical protein
LSVSPIRDGRLPYKCVHPSSGPINSKDAVKYE